jgi:hypothetical protein
MLVRQVQLARRVARFVFDHDGYELLPVTGGKEVAVARIFMIVLFRARDERINVELVKRINKTGKIYVSGTKWEGKPAARIAVSNWRVDVERDVKLIEEVLRGVLD